MGIYGVGQYGRVEIDVTVCAFRCFKLLRIDDRAVARHGDDMFSGVNGLLNAE